MIKSIVTALKWQKKVEGGKMANYNQPSKMALNFDLFQNELKEHGYW